MSKTFDAILEESKAEPEFFQTVDHTKKRVIVWDAAEYWHSNPKVYRKWNVREQREAFYHFHKGVIAEHWVANYNGVRCDAIIRNGVIMAQRVVDLQTELDAMRKAQS